MRHLITTALILIAGCSRSQQLKNADFYYNQGIYPKAIKLYEKNLKKAPGNEEKILALLGLGRSFAKLGRHQRSLIYYEQAARLDPLHALAETARRELIANEDYFPLKSNLYWEEVDSATKGNNLFAVNKVHQQGSYFALRRSIYAGKPTNQNIKPVHEIWLFYTKKNGILWQRAGHPQAQEATLLLRYPYVAGATWITQREKQNVRRTITRSAFAMTIAAGVFEHCLEVAEEVLGEEAAAGAGGTLGAGGAAPAAATILETYCLNAGRVQTATSAKGQKTPLVEMAQFR